MLNIFALENYKPGYRQFHGEPFLDFEINRWLPYMDEAEVSVVVRGIKTLSDWKREMIALGEKAEGEGRALHAGTYYRAAEFYMLGRDGLRLDLIKKYMRLFDEAVADWPLERHAVPYRGGELPVLVMRAEGERRETLVIHGGFDSYKEEYCFAAPAYAAQGFDVVIFDGPGQGQAIRAHGLTMTAEWEEPVGAVLDHFGIDSCTLMGFSLGGYLAPRAAAFEPRIKRLIADDQLTDFFAAFTSKVDLEIAGRLEGMVERGEREAVNTSLTAMGKQSETAAWAIAHGLEISGSDDGFEFLKWLTHLRTAPFSERIHQDVLLLGAKDDHIVPISQWYDQIGTLTNVRSLTAQLFTRADHAHTHCHVSNTPLIIDYVITWLNFQLRTEAARRHLPQLS